MGTQTDQKTRPLLSVTLDTSDWGVVLGAMMHQMEHHSTYGNFELTEPIEALLSEVRTQLSAVTLDQEG